MNIIWGLRLEPQVQVWPLLEPEPEPQTPGSKSGSDWVQKVQEPEHGQFIALPGSLYSPLTPPCYTGHLP